MQAGTQCLFAETVEGAQIRGIAFDETLYVLAHLFVFSVELVDHFVCVVIEAKGQESLCA